MREYRKIQEEIQAYCQSASKEEWASSLVNLAAMGKLRTYWEKDYCIFLLDIGIPNHIHIPYARGNVRQAINDVLAPLYRSGVVSFSYIRKGKLKVVIPIKENLRLILGPVLTEDSRR